MTEKMTLTVVMPALNEELNIQDAVLYTLKALEKYNIDGEVLVVNDGSTDKTKEIVENITKTNSNVRILDHEKANGIGFSFWDGVKHSDREIVVLIPGDNEVDVEDALRYFYLMQDVDIVVPFFHNVEVRDRFRRIVSSLYRYIINISFGISLNYTNGTVFYRRELLDEVELNSYGFFYQAELLIKLIRKGYIFAEVPCFLGVREGGKSKAISLKSLMQVARGYLKLVYDVHIKWFEARKKDYFKLNQNSATSRRLLEFEERIKAKSIC